MDVHLERKQFFQLEWFTGDAVATTELGLFRIISMALPFKLHQTNMNQLIFQMPSECKIKNCEQSNKTPQSSCGRT